MTTATFEIISNDTLDVHSQKNQEIDAKLRRVIEKDGNKPPEYLLDVLTTVARNHIPLDSTDEEALKTFYENVPAAVELTNAVGVVAEQVLEASGEFDADSSLSVQDLGDASDITGDPSIAERTIEKLQHTRDYGLLDLRTALERSLVEDVSFHAACKSIKASRKGSVATRTNMDNSQREILDLPSPITSPVRTINMGIPLQGDQFRVIPGITNSDFTNAHVEELNNLLRKDD